MIEGMVGELISDPHLSKLLRCTQLLPSWVARCRSGATATGVTAVRGALETVVASFENGAGSDSAASLQEYQQLEEVLRTSSPILGKQSKADDQMANALVPGLRTRAGRLHRQQDTAGDEHW